MITYLSLRISPQDAREVWCVGYYREDGVWVPERLYTYRGKADSYAGYLNSLTKTDKDKKSSRQSVDAPYRRVPKHYRKTISNKNRKKTA